MVERFRHCSEGFGQAPAENGDGNPRSPKRILLPGGAAIQVNVRFGSLADIGAATRCPLTPKSGHAQRQHRCPLSANSGHVLSHPTKLFRLRPLLLLPSCLGRFCISQVFKLFFAGLFERGFALSSIRHLDG